MTSFCNFFNPSKKNSFGCAANRKIENRKSQRLISTLTYCVRYSVFGLFCVQVAALRRADPPSKGSYGPCIGSRKLEKRPRPNGGL
jgi:hypothetical protein